MDLIADTNLWYDLAAGRRSRTDPNLHGDLLATPITFVEITGKLSPASFSERRGAAQAILKYAARIAPDPETYLSLQWGLGDPGLEINWKAGFDAVANANSLQEITSGVPDKEAGVTRSVNTQAAQTTRMLHWQGFADDIESVMEADLPGYKASRAAGGKLKQLRGAARLAFEQKVKSAATRDEIVAATYARASVVHNKPASRPPAALLLKTGPVFERYARAYMQYIFACGTGMAPQANDWGDLEHFIYLDGSNALVTADKRWLKIAVDAGIGSDVR